MYDCTRYSRILHNEKAVGILIVMQNGELSAFQKITR